MADNAKKLSSSLEDYLEAIYNLSENSGIARSRGIADALNVSRSSVTGALRTLTEKELVNYKPYGYVTLTQQGSIIAKKVVRRHNVIKSFFIDILGVEDIVAQNAACQAEHALGPGVINRLLDFIKFINHNSRNGVDITSQFKEFCRSNTDNKTENQAELS